MNVKDSFRQQTGPAHGSAASLNELDGDDRSKAREAVLQELVQSAAEPLLNSQDKQRWRSISVVEADDVDWICLPASEVRVSGGKKRNVCVGLQSVMRGTDWLQPLHTLLEIQAMWF